MTGRALTTIVEGELVGYDPGQDQTVLGRAGQAANKAAAAGVFVRYRRDVSLNTNKSKAQAVDKFAQFIARRALEGRRASRAAAWALLDTAKRIRQFGRDFLDLDVVPDPETWRGFSWGLLEEFVDWQLEAGAAVRSVNARLAHLKVIARECEKAGAVTAPEYVTIQGVKGIKAKAAANLNEKRRQRGIPTRIGSKKASPTLLNSEQAEALMDDHPDTPQGRRDRVLAHLAAKHGLRVSELALLTVDNFTLTRDKAGKVKAGVMRFYRPKLKGTDHEWGEHLLLNGTLDAVAAYMDNDAPAIGPLFRASHKGGALTGAGMAKRSLTIRIKTLGKRAGVGGLTAHDCRHYAATRDGKRNKSVAFLCAKYGWTTAQTALRYVHIEGPVVVD